MLYKRLISAALVFGGAALAPPATADPLIPCYMRQEIALSLSSRFGETLAGFGLQSPTQLVELWRSPDTGTFTVLISFADGTSCVLASGVEWRAIADVPAEIAG